jgi:hypothetical protein
MEVKTRSSWSERRNGLVHMEQLLLFTRYRSRENSNRFATILAKFKNRGREVLAFMAHSPSQKREKSVVARGYVDSKSGAGTHKKKFGK